MGYKTQAIFDEPREDFFVREQQPDKPQSFINFANFLNDCIARGTTDGARLDEEIIRNGQVDYAYSRVFTNIDDANQYEVLVNQLSLAPLEVIITQVPFGLDPA